MRETGGEGKGGGMEGSSRSPTTAAAPDVVAVAPVGLPQKQTGEASCSGADSGGRDATSAALKRENESLRMQLEQEMRRRRSVETEVSTLKMKNMNLQSEVAMVELEEEKITNTYVARAAACN